MTVEAAGIARASLALEFDHVSVPAAVFAVPAPVEIAHGGCVGLGRVGGWYVFGE